MLGKALRAPCTRGLLRPMASMPSRGIKAFTHDPLTSEEIGAAVNKLEDEEPARLAMLREDYTLDDEQIALVEKDRAVELKEKEEFGPLGDPRKMGTHDNYFEEMMNKPAGDPTSRFFTYAVTGGAYATSMIATKSILNRMGKYFWMNPYMVEQGTVEVDFAHLTAGDTMAVNWRGKCVYIKYRTDAEIEQARADDGSDDLKDPEPDANRVERPEVLIVSGVCTHLGCVPLPNEGDYPGGFFCPCHGSHYDNSGRIRKGPAPLNLEVPPYKFLGDSALQLG